MAARIKLKSPAGEVAIVDLSGVKGVIDAVDLRVLCGAAAAGDRLVGLAAALSPSPSLRTPFSLRFYELPVCFPQYVGIYLGMHCSYVRFHGFEERLDPF